jgi:hypothetical protein
METLTKAVDLKNHINAHRVLVEQEQNANKASTQLIVFVPQGSMGIPTLAVMTLMNVLRKFAAKTQFVSTHQEVTTVNVSKALLAIHSKCVRQLEKDFVKILQTANAAKTSLAQQGSNASEANAKIFAIKSNVVRELLAMPELVFVHQDTMEIQVT